MMAFLGACYCLFSVPSCSFVSVLKIASPKSAATRLCLCFWFGTVSVPSAVAASQVLVDDLTLAEVKYSFCPPLTGAHAMPLCDAHQKGRPWFCFYSKPLYSARQDRFVQYYNAAATRKEEMLRLDDLIN